MLASRSLLRLTALGLAAALLISLSSCSSFRVRPHHQSGGQTVKEDISQWTVDKMTEVFAAIGVEPTLRRGFALVTRPGGSVVRGAGELSRGERVVVRMADGSVGMVVEET